MNKAKEPAAFTRAAGSFVAYKEPGGSPLPVPIFALIYLPKTHFSKAANYSSDFLQNIYAVETVFIYADEF